MTFAAVGVTIFRSRSAGICVTEGESTAGEKAEADSLAGDNSSGNPNAGPGASSFKGGAGSVLEGVRGHFDALAVSSGSSKGVEYFWVVHKMKEREAMWPWSSSNRGHRTAALRRVFQ